MTGKKKQVQEALPIRLTHFFLSVTGFILAKNEREKLIANMITAYSAFAISFACISTIVDIYMCRNSFYDFVYSFIAFGTCFIVQLKFGILVLRKQRYLKLIAYTKDILWTRHHTEYGRAVIKQCEKQAMFFIITFSCFAQSVGVCYIVQPIVYNIGRNGTDRTIPFTLWIGSFVYETPWFEMFFGTEVFTCQHTAISYFCFDNYLALVNIFTTGQFKILRNRLETLFDGCTGNKNQTRDHNVLAREFKKCVEQHQILLELVQEVEAVYTLINLFQVLVFSFLICFVGYQLLLPGNTLMRRILFFCYCGGCFTQLFTFTFTSNNLTVASIEVSEGPWYSKWYTQLQTSRDRILAKDLAVVIMRAQRPCQLTALGFFPITVNTFKSMLSTAFSYLTLMRRSEQRS